MKLGETDFRAAIEKALDKGDRGDENSPHVSDLFACRRQVWARRNGVDFAPFDTATLWKFALGHAVEDVVADAIVADLRAEGTFARRNGRVAWDPIMGLARPLAPSGTFAGEPDDQELVGHYDIAIEDERSNTLAIGEVKSTWFATRNVVTAKPGHIMQATGYAEAYGCEDFFLQYVTVVITGGRTKIELAPTIWLKTGFYRDEAIALARDLLVKTKPGSPEPDATPMETWNCRYCRHLECPKNLS